MSGYFLQCGEFVFVLKWFCIRMVLVVGVDLVVELFYVFFIQKVEIFVSGVIFILEFFCVDFICFGSENGNIDLFICIVDLFEVYELELFVLI